MIRPGAARLRPSDDIGRADWIRDRLVGFGLGVHSVVPGGFAAYVRVLHPAEGPPPEWRLVRWAEVAKRAGVAMHGSIDFAELADALDRLAGAERWEVDKPVLGNLDPEPLAALCDVLARHTATPEACWFGVWDGHGWLSPAVAFAVFTRISVDPDEPGRDAAPATEPPAPSFALTWTNPSPPLPLVELPWREYRLLTGPLDAALEVGRLVNGAIRPPFPLPSLARRPRLVRRHRRRPPQHLHRRPASPRRRTARRSPHGGVDRPGRRPAQLTPSTRPDQAGGASGRDMARPSSQALGT